MTCSDSVLSNCTLLYYILICFSLRHYFYSIEFYITVSCLTKVHNGDPLDVFPVHIQGVGSTYQKRREEKRKW